MEVLCFLGVEEDSWGLNQDWHQAAFRALFFSGYIGVILGLYWGNIRVILGPESAVQGLGSKGLRV